VDDSPLPIVTMLVVIPLIVTVVLGIISTRRATPLVFHCRRCDHIFHQPPHHRFPLACPRCHARDWSAPRR
jgi:Zn finger protein HypA/HybF involved in hydrogenase expression